MHKTLFVVVLVALVAQAYGQGLSLSNTSLGLILLLAAKTACQLQQEKEKTNESPMKLDVKCLPNGDYAPLQCFPGNKFCYCALPDGSQISQPSRNRKFCKCTLEKHEEEKKLNVNGRPIDRKQRKLPFIKFYKIVFFSAAPRGSYVPSCQRDGLYTPKQCETGTDVCWCVNQDGAQTSKDKRKDITCA